jgi:hypothetical protein
MTELLLLVAGIALCIVGGLIAFSALDYRLPGRENDSGMLVLFSADGFSDRGCRLLSRARALQLFGAALVLLSMVLS